MATRTIIKIDIILGITRPDRNSEQRAKCALEITA
jgi:hypothetical protein